MSSNPTGVSRKKKNIPCYREWTFSRRRAEVSQLKTFEIENAKDFITASVQGGLIYQGLILNLLRKVQGDEWMYDFLSKTCGLDSGRYDFYYDNNGLVKYVDKEPFKKEPLDYIKHWNPELNLLE